MLCLHIGNLFKKIAVPRPSKPINEFYMQNPTSAYPAATYDVETYGKEGEHVVVMDNFTENFDALLRAGQSCNYSFNGGFYPGVQAAANINYLASNQAIILKALREVFNYSSGVRGESCAFSLVSKPVHTLHPMQRMPHFDSQDGKLFALLHYIQGPKTAGTAFYRHRRTGFETITADRVKDYDKAIEDDIAEYGAPKSEYIHGDTPGFELLLNIEARPNRAILYRGRTLHSGIIPKDLPLTTNTQRARMTLNTFLWAI